MVMKFLKLEKVLQLCVSKSEVNVAVITTVHTTLKAAIASLRSFT